jgi:hypothetical protein
MISHGIIVSHSVCPRAPSAVLPTAERLLPDQGGRRPRALAAVLPTAEQLLPATKLSLTPHRRRAGAHCADVRLEQETGEQEEDGGVTKLTR